MNDITEFLVPLGQKLYENGEQAIKELIGMDQVSCPVVHRFEPGFYIRELHAKAGTFMVGHEQRYDHFNDFIKGAVRILNPDGSTTDLVAPMSFIGKKGRKCGLVLEDMIWRNVYQTDETDIDTLEATYLIKPDFWGEHEKSLAQNRLEDQLDYVLMLGEVGITHEQVRIEVENEQDQIAMPAEWVGANVRNSPLDGKGFFASVPFLAGSVIAPARIGGKRTPAGRYTNHSFRPNAKMVNDDGDIYLVAIKDIQGCMGGGMGEEITVDYRQALSVNANTKGKSCLE